MPLAKDLASPPLPEFQRYREIFARVRIGGRAILLGLYDSAEARAQYHRLIAQWLTQAPVSAALPPDPAAPATIEQVVVRFSQHIQDIFKTSSGRDTGTRENYRPTLKLLVELYGDTVAEDFGPLALKTLRKAMVQRGMSRRSINDAAARIKRVFRFAASEELVSERVPVRLAQVDGLRRGETTAAEPVKVTPVRDEIVDATLPYLPKVVADMVRLQRLTGARPGEIVQLRPMDVDRSQEIWSYVPREHKTEHHGCKRVICLGPQAQAVLSPYLLRAADACCFSPQEVWEGKSWRQGRRRKPGTVYTIASYRRAITRACEKAFEMPKALRRAKARETLEEKTLREQGAADWRALHAWHPHQLRHTAATKIRAQFGLESAQVTLGHTSMKTTEIYAERDFQLARRVAQAIG